MTEPSGIEYVLESTSQRTTSVVVRKSPNICTLTQKTPLGVGIVELSEDAKTALLGLLQQPFAPAHIRHDQSAAFEAFKASVAEEPQRRKPGRPPKSEAA
jgi:hypothetical protein